jgi:hypothetical protein
MGGRDHSYECENCGVMCGGLNDAPCDCDFDEDGYYVGESGIEGLRFRLDRLASNLQAAAMLCRAFEDGYKVGAEAVMRGLYTTNTWRPGCDRASGET